MELARVNKRTYLLGRYDLLVRDFRYGSTLV